MLSRVSAQESGAQGVKTDYTDGFVYENDQLSFFAFSEGRVRLTNNDFRYEYDYADHLGNVRLTFDNENGVAEVLQADSYYPFGLKMPNLSYVRDSENKFTYNGKELEDEFGLNWYHYGVRFYDAAVGRWWAIDPAEEFHSPFVYVGNTPTFFIDPDGTMSDCPDCINDEPIWMDEIVVTAQRLDPFSIGFGSFGFSNFVNDWAQRELFYRPNIQALEKYRNADYYTRLNASRTRNSLILETRSRLSPFGQAYSEFLKPSSSLSANPNGRFWVVNPKQMRNARMAGSGGGILFVYGAYVSIDRVANAAPEAQTNVAIEEASAWAGALSVGYASGKIGGGVGFLICGPPCATAGAFLGGLGGSIYGAYAGTEISKSFMD